MGWPVKKPAKAPAKKTQVKKTVTQVKPRSRAVAVVRSEHPGKAAMRKLLEERQYDREFNHWLGEQVTANAATIHNLVEQVAALTAVVIAGQVPVPTTMFDSAKMLTVNQACHVLGDVDENRLYRSDLKPVAGTLYADADALRDAYPERFNEARFQQIKAKNDQPRKKDRARVQLLSRKSGN
jgi:hypothetical protein